MRIALRIAGVAAVLALSASAAFAEVIPFLATLSGADETPANASTGGGVAVFAMDTDANTLTYVINYANLGGTESAAHIHGFTTPGLSASPVHTLPATAGFKTGQWTYPQGNEAQIIAGLTYVNIHTSSFPNGEIRGQILRTDVAVDQKTWSGVKGLYGAGR